MIRNIIIYIVILSILPILTLSTAVTPRAKISGARRERSLLERLREVGLWGGRRQEQRPE